MDRKYQIFVSSTYRDMGTERQAVVETILQTGNIPAGMELFAAADKSQLDIIYRWIDDSDIFMLMLGGRYGSIENESGKSFIELEYDYAIKIGKPYFSIVMTKSGIEAKTKGPLGLDAIEQANSAKLNVFRDRVLSKICSEFDNVDQLQNRVQHAIYNAVKSHNLVGWIRGDNAVGPEVLGEIARLSQENAELRSKLIAAERFSEMTKFAAPGTAGIKAFVQAICELNQVQEFKEQAKSHKTYFQPPHRAQVDGRISEGRAAVQAALASMEIDYAIDKYYHMRSLARSLASKVSRGKISSSEIQSFSDIAIQAIREN